MKALRSALQDRRFEPAYYFIGEDEFLKEEALRHLVEAAIDPGTRDFNLDQRKGGELDATALEALLATPPMMADRRVIVIREVAALKKDARAMIERYLKSPAADILVILSATADSKEDKTIASLTVPIECKPLTGAQVPKWIVSRAERLGASITQAAVELLQNAVGADLSQLALELEKLSAFTSGSEIDEDAVAQVVGVRRDETPSRLLDAVAMRNSTEALSLLPGVLSQPKVGAVPLVMALTTQMLAIGVGKARAVPPARLSGEYFALLRSGSSNLTLRAWGEAVNSWARATPRWTIADVDHALAALLQADLALKSSRVSSEEQILSVAILAMCAGPTSHAATAA